MKLRNFMYATMIACAFASCSKDDVIENGPDPVAGDATLTIAAQFPNPSTKAETTSDVEKTINDLTIVLVNAQGQLADADGSIDASAKRKTYTLTPGTYKFRVFANMSVSAQTLNEAIQTNVALPADGFSADNLPMYSEEYTVTLVAGDNGTTNVELKRTVARVDIDAIYLDMGNEALEGVDQYTGGKVTLNYKGLSVNGVAGQSQIDGTVITEGTTYYRGCEDAYTIFAGNTKVDFYATTASVEKVQVYNEGWGSEVKVAENAGSFYILPNNITDQNATTVLVNAVWKIENGVNSNGSNINATGGGYYPIRVGIDGIAGGQTSPVVKANTVYSIELFIAGPGKNIDGAGDATWTVKATAVDFDYKKQSWVGK